ncbi:spore gernimation protein [Bacillus lacus]|uniref:Spore gernimation protein n=1 Tax=Metabacillus lacus TaxID=1983721 RepID=A0A7X2IX08_9BACI|nr:spore morphogenesis/germination protein YwcE [Metabacillus lacus]MRX71169.1 spore gernimation protein [Metabacillus lacus]
MDMFFAYMMIATATPLFLLPEHKKLAAASIPFISAMWITFFMYYGAEASMLFHTAFLLLFTLNVLMAHFAAFIIFAIPVIREQREQKQQLEGAGN